MVCLFDGYLTSRVIEVSLGTINPATFAPPTRARRAREEERMVWDLWEKE